MKVEVSKQNKRINLTKLKTYTIDDLSANEIDDAISLEKFDDKNYLWIHISNPTYIVEKDSIIDKIAQERANTLYLVEETFNMLPVEKNNKLLGFKPKNISDALSLCIEISHNGDIISAIIYDSYVEPNYQLTYDDADELIELQPAEEIELYEIYKLTKIIHQKRVSNGAISFKQIVGNFTGSINDPTVIYKYKSYSRILIEEMMILMGYVISNISINFNIPMIYRVQDKSIIPKNNENINLDIFESYLKRKLKKAYYSCIPSIHFSLGLKSYVHCTSPLRRYTDLLVHRQLTNYINNKELYDQAQLSYLLSKINIKINNGIQLYRQEQLKCLNNWLYINKDNDIEGYFISNLNIEEDLFLIRLKDLEQDVICFLKQKIQLILGDQLLIKYDSLSQKDSYPRFTIRKPS